MTSPTRGGPAGQLNVVHAVQTASFAGVERYIANLGAQQAVNGYRVRVIGGDRAAMQAAIANPQVRVETAHGLLGTAYRIDAWRDCQVLHLHMTAAELAAVAAVRSWHVPAVSTRHFAQRRGSSRAARLAGRFAAMRVSAQVAVSRFVAEAIDGDSVVVYPGVPSVSDLLMAEARTQTVLVAQRLEVEKETHLALHAFAASGLAESGWRLDIAGDGAQRKSLEALTEELGIADGVRFLGRRSDLPDLMRNAGILLATAPREHFGLTVVEAMAVGLPVVATGTAGHLETVGLSVNPAFFTPGDASHAGSLLAGLAGDEERRDLYGMDLRRIQRERFTLEAQALQVDAVYRSVL